MVEEDPQEDPQEDLQEAPRERRALLVRWLFWLPLLACSACLLVFTLIEPALPAPQRSGTAPIIPSTGADPLVPPTLTPGPPAEESSTPVPDLDRKILSYREEAALRIELCSAAFHHLFILEQTAFHNPGMAASGEYRENAGVAMQDFRDACQPLGQMPSAPAAYRDVDRWLKLAAGEVSPAADTFTAALTEKDDASESMERAMDHMMRFMEYTSRAQDLLERLDRRKNI